jgi:hypothetical protein
MKSEAIDRPSVVSFDLVQTFCERRRFTSSDVSCEFPQISCIVLCEIIIVRLGCHNFLAKCVPKMLVGSHKSQRIFSALTFTERYKKDGDKFFRQIVTGDETWILLLRAEIKEQAKSFMYIHSTNKPKKYKKKRLPARKLLRTVF